LRKGACAKPDSRYSISGVINIDKPAGITSHDVVGKVRRIAGTKRVGHAGTLDPMATGVLLVCLDSATRLADFLADRGKIYVAGFVLGSSTSTEDSTGEVTGETDASAITEDAVRTALAGFVGDIDQVPPMVSAVHHEGRRLYELARAGVTVEREARTIRIDSIELLEFTPGERARGTLRIQCGKGTYVRTICADLGAVLGVGGHMTALRRIAVGRFTADAAVSLERLAADGVQSHLIPSADALDFLPLRTASPPEVVDIGHGRPIPSADDAIPPGAWVRVVDETESLIALGIVAGNGSEIRPAKVFEAGR
jgi:tRNA pseudouridine55 synthase